MKHKNHILLIALLATGFVACKPEEEAKTETEVMAIPVETMTITTQKFVDRVEVSGVVEPIHEVKVSAEAAGRVLSAPFEEGDKIKKGKLLLRVDSDLNSAQIALLQSQLATAKREFERTKKLASQGLATPQQLDQAQAQVDSSNLSIKQARVGMGKTNVRSPIEGWVATKSAEKGEYVNPGAPLAHIVDYSTVKVNAAIPESDIRFIREEEPVEIYLPALDLSVDGKVYRRGIVATPNTRTFPVEIHVENKDLKLLPGMRARIIVPRKDWGSVVLVPRDSILEGYQRQEAMVLPTDGKEGKAELHVVKLGPTSGESVVVTEGLKDGDRLIVKGHRSIVDGTLVKVVAEREANAKSKPQAEQAPADEAGKDDESASKSKPDGDSKLAEAK